MSDNPYAAVETGPSSLAGQTTALPLSQLAREVFLAWEKMRIAFIGILALPTLAFVAMYGLVGPGLLVLVVFGAVVANVCYMAGPIVETYVRWLGYTSLWPRVLMFASGTLLTLIAEVLSLLTLVP